MYNYCKLDFQFFLCDCTTAPVSSFDIHLIFKVEIKIHAMNETEIYFFEQ